jgi:hypothetical protein
VTRTGHDRKPAAGVRDVIAAIARGDIDTAQEAFRSLAQRTSVGEAAQTLGRAAHPPAGAIIVGTSMAVYANPFRGDTYSWRCGSCPWTANNYKTRRGAEKSADEHAGEHPGIKVRWLTRPIGA